jgi:hypothetical protein
MNHKTVVTVALREGDEVELLAGSYQGTLGVFLGLREDVKWADIAERNGSVRMHPVEWLGRPGTRFKRGEN